jgi:alpha-2-macroglobulin
VDDRTWSYDFAADLPAGVRCTFTLVPGLRSLAGQPLAGGERHAFDTGGPSIVISEPREGHTRIDENQIFLLGLDAPVKTDTVLRHAACVVGGNPERIPVSVVEGEARKAVLDLRRSFLVSYYRAVLKSGADRRAFVLGVPERGTERDRLLALRDGERSPVVLLKCQRTLPNGSKVELVWGAGIETASGLATRTTRALAFATRPEFVANFSCDRTNRKAQCIPVLPLRLSFTAPVPVADARRIRLVEPDGQVRTPLLSEREAAAGFVDAVSFAAPLPERTAFRLEVPADLRDDAGRPLDNAGGFPLTVRTDPSPPLAKFSARFGIVERYAEPGGRPLLAVTLRNLEPRLAVATRHGPPAADAGPIPGRGARVSAEVDVIPWLRRLADLDRDEYRYDEKTKRSVAVHRSGQTSLLDRAAGVRRFTLPKPGGARPFEVVGIPLDGPGLHLVELASPRLGAVLFDAQRPYYVQAAALVTNLAVHLKLGRESSLVWVTRLDRGTPVADADVAVRDCGGKVHYRGRTGADGVLRVERALPERESLPDCLQRQDRQYFVTARVGDDFSFVLSDWNDGIAPWRFGLPQGSADEGAGLHAVLDRSLLRAGETVRFKAIWRKRTRDGFAPIDFAPLPKLVARHTDSGDAFDIPVAWDARGTATGSWTVPREARQGSSEILAFEPAKPQAREWRAAGFRVESFRIPTMRAVLKGPDAPLVAAARAEVDVQLSYLSGGGAAGAPVKLRARLQPREVTFTDHDGFAFANGDVKLGADERGTEAWPDGDYEPSEPDEPDDADGDTQLADGARETPAANAALPTRSVRLDAAGGARIGLDGIGRSDRPRDLLTELEYADANGETSTASARIPVWPSSVLVGVKPDGWLLTRDRVRVQVLVVDLAGHPVAGRPARLDALKREYYAHRKRMVGGFYAFENSSEVKRLGTLCEGVTDARGLLLCEARSPDAGNLILRASSRDAAGNESVANQGVWVAGSDDEWFAGSDTDRIDLLPEKPRYEPGETARLQLRTPFKSGTVLVTTEREGVVDGFVRTVTRDRPTIELPVHARHAPNVFVSALVVRGRVGGVQPTALVDLGKPAFKLGMAQLRVGWSAFELAVRLRPDRDTYPVRGTATIVVDARMRDGTAPPAGTEVSLAVVDEGLLELAPNESWKLLDDMMRERGIEVVTSTAQMQVVGRRHFGRKAVPAGGGGGRGLARELFDPVAHWQARVKLDPAGHATVSFPLNDSLTSFRVAAIAEGGEAAFGTGYTTVRTTQDLILTGGLPPLVREQDRFHAGFTLRNASARPIEAILKARLTASPAEGAASAPELPVRSARLAPGEARELAWEIAVPAGADTLHWEVDAREAAGGSDRSDRMKLSQRVVPAVPVRVVQATLAQLDGSRRFAVRRPADALPGRGGIRVTLRSRLADAMPGVRDYMSAYPYACLEQLVSKTVALQDEPAFAALAAGLDAWLDRDGLARYFVFLPEGSDTLTAYLLTLSAEAGWRLPPGPLGGMRQGLTDFVAGRVVRYSDLPTADLTLRKLAAIAALARSGGVPAKSLDGLAIEPTLWPTSAVLDWLDVLQRVDDVPRRDARREEARHILAARMYYQGTTLAFSTERDDALWWLMAGADVNANRALAAATAWPYGSDDVGRLARGALARQVGGHWNTTVANAWGVLAMRGFSRTFESRPVTGRTVLELAGRTDEAQWDGTGRTAQSLLPWPSDAAELAVSHRGDGKPWIAVESLAAIPLAAPLSSGFSVTRQVRAVEQRVPGSWHRGDVARVRLEVDAAADATWVVVDDPIPAGGRILGGGLGRDSRILATGERRQGDVQPAFEERRDDAFRAYYRVVPKGRWAVEYTVRYGQAGTFGLPATHAEAMYAPDAFGDLPNAAVVVGE